MSGVVTPRLGRLVRGSEGTREAEPERCELCGGHVPASHRHLLNLDADELMCACRACATLFDGAAAGGGHYRLVPDRRLRLDDFELDDALWEELEIPVDVAFFFHGTRAGRVLSFYPGPMGATASELRLEAWSAIEAANPVLETLEPDVEALLVNRTRGARRHWIVPIDECYALAGLMRTSWRGLTGGKQVWLELDRFTETLDRRSRGASGKGRERGCSTR